MQEVSKDRDIVSSKEETEERSLDEREADKKSVAQTEWYNCLWYRANKQYRWGIL